MASEAGRATADADDAAEPASAGDHAVLEYIGALAQELGVMARRAGEEPLARLLEMAAATAAARSEGPATRPHSL